MIKWIDTLINNEQRCWMEKKIQTKKFQIVVWPTCFKWFLRIVPSGSGNGGISSDKSDGGVNLFESRSTCQISPGNLFRRFLYLRKNVYIPHIQRSVEWHHPHCHLYSPKYLKIFEIISDKVHSPEIFLKHQKRRWNTNNEWCWCEQ